MGFQPHPLDIGYFPHAIDCVRISISYLSSTDILLGQRSDIFLYVDTKQIIYF